MWRKMIRGKFSKVNYQAKLSGIHSFTHFSCNDVLPCISRLIKYLWKRVTLFSRSLWHCAFPNILLTKWSRDCWTAKSIMNIQYMLTAALFMDQLDPGRASFYTRFTMNPPCHQWGCWVMHENLKYFCLNDVTWVIWGWRLQVKKKEKIKSEGVDCRLLLASAAGEQLEAPLASINRTHPDLRPDWVWSLCIVGNVQSSRQGRRVSGTEK